MSLRAESLPYTIASRLPHLLGNGTLQFAAIVLQLGLLILVVQLFSIEHSAFLKVLVLSSVGCVINHYLPQQARIPFFAALSLIAIVWVLGIRYGGPLIAMGSGLIALAHAPVSFRLRLVFLTIATGLLMYLRLRTGFNPIWPVFGAMFVFRMIVYLYDLNTKAAPFGPWRALAYFFMIPSVCFPLFPIIDYKTFCRTHYNGHPVDIYQKGIVWMLRGVIHLLGYRLISQHFVIEPGSVNNLGDLSQMMLATFMLYLKVSGLFHLIIGQLHLFGWNLSETHHLYLLSSSFTDFWRRINIYWKDFIQKILFYPLFFRLKHRGELFAMVMGTVIAFVGTWLLHSYQDFWILGSFRIRWQDMAFWSILGAGVATNIVFEMKTKRVSSLTRVKRTVAGETRKALKTIMFFVFIVTAWSLWSATSWDEWITMVSKARHSSGIQVAMIVGVLSAVGASAVLFGHTTSQRSDGARGGTAARTSNERFWRGVAGVMAASLLLVVIGANPQWFRSSPRIADVLGQLLDQPLANTDDQIQERGYYEDLTDLTTYNFQLWSLYMGQPADWRSSPSERATGSFPKREYIPLTSHPFKGAMRSINSWGMRDGPYEKVKPPDVYRMVLVGASHSAGTGVRDAETYENLVERRLNAELSPHTGRKYEILNFAVGGDGPYARFLTLERKAFEFKPDAVLFEIVNDTKWNVRDVAEVVVKGISIPDAFLTQLAHEAGVSKGMDMDLALKKLEPYGETLAKWLFARLVERGKELGIEVYGVSIPKTQPGKRWKNEARQEAEWARSAGITVLSMTDAYDNVANLKTLWIRPWDNHPNAGAHQLLASTLYDELTPHLQNARVPLYEEKR